MFELMNKIDVEVAALISQIRSPGLDWFYVFISHDEIRVVPLALLLVYVFLNREGSTVGRELFILRGITGIVAANIACVVVRQLVPQRPRPRLALDFIAWPDIGNLSDLADFKTFPSDTVTFAMAMTTVIAARSTPLGVVALLWTVLIPAFGRVYIGYHYLSDVVAACLLGPVVCFFFLRRLERPFLFGSYYVSLLNSHAPRLFVVLLFFAVQQFADLYPIPQLIVRNVRIAMHVLRGV